MSQYNKVGFVNEVLAGSPTYNISGTGAGQTIDLDQTVTQAGTPVNADNLGTVETGILANDYDRRYIDTTSTVTTKVAYALDKDGTYTALTNDELVRFKPDVDSDTDISTGSFVLDGINDYGTLPASVGQLTNGSNAFELIAKFNYNATDFSIIAKTDTAYNATALPNGWRLQIGTNKITLVGINGNGGTAGVLTGSTTLTSGTDYWAKITFNGTTVEAFLSTDGVIYSSEGTSTDANLIAGLTISDAVDTQIGRRWQGSSGFNYYMNGTIYEITLSKVATPTNEYLFKNFGTNTAILDTVGTDDGSSFNGATQTEILTPAPDTPTLQVDSTTAKELQGALPLVAGNTYVAKYNSTDDKFDVANDVFDIEASTEITPEGGVTLSGSSTTIPNLDIVSDGGVYEIYVANLVVSGGDNLNFFINGDTVTTNYYRDSLTDTTNQNDARISTSVTTNPTTLKITMNFNGGDVIYTTIGGTKISGTNLRDQYYTNMNKITQSNVTSITFSLGATTFTSGTVKVFKRS